MSNPSAVCNASTHDPVSVQRTIVVAGTGAATDFSGTWKNELESTMTLTQRGDRLEGSYESKVSSTGGTTTGDLLGFVDGDLVSFLVHWRDFQAITAWVGQVDSDGVTIRTLWQMTKQVDAGSEWASINAGCDAFERTA